MKNREDMDRSANYAVKIAAIYAFFGFLWILFSDRLVSSLALEIQTVNYWQTYKGWFYVLVTSVLVWWLVRKDFLAIARVRNNLKRSEEHFKRLFHQAPLSYQSLDRNACLLDVNDTWLETLGYTRDEVIGRPFANLLTELSKVSFSECFDRFCNCEEIHGAEFDLVRKDGSHLTASFHGKVVQDERGSFVQTDCIFYDVTDRNRIIAELQFSEEKFRDLAENIKEVFWLMTPDKQLLYVSPVYEEVWGQKCDELYHNPDAFLDAIHPVDRARIVSELNSERYKREGTYNTRYRIIRSDGTIRWIWSRRFPVCTADGTVIRIAGIAEDITELIEQRDEIHQLAQFPNENPNPVLRISRDGILLFANQSAQSICEHEGLRVNRFIPESWRDKAAAAFHSQKPVNHELDCGKNMYAMVFAPVSDAGYINVYANDITQLKKTEQQLRQAQKMEAIGELAGGIAHDFNNLLQAMMGYADLASMGLSPEDKRYQDLQHVLKTGERATALTRQLLVFSRKQSLHLEEVSLDQLIPTLSKMLQRWLGEDIELQFTPGSHNCIIRADAGALEQAIVNLCLNARDAMPDGGQLTIETTVCEINDAVCQHHLWASPGRYVQLKVADSGTGMSPEILDRIFEPFFTTKSKEKGTGLGLSMVYGIVRQHGGFINVYSEPSLGTTFNLFFPSCERPKGQSLSGEPEIVQGGTETILFAEDDPMVRKLSQRILETNGYQVYTASDGQEALQIFQQKLDEIHLIILDVVMPKVGGQQVYQQIQAIRPTIPVLFSTGYNPNMAQTQFISREGHNLLPKPYSSVMLLKKVRELLDRQ